MPAAPKNNRPSLHPVHQEELERFFLLKSAFQSWEFLKQQKNAHDPKSYKRRNRYLRNRVIANSFSLFWEALVWNVKQWLPWGKREGQPGFWENMRMLANEPQFRPLRLAFISWFIFTFAIGSMGFYAFRTHQAGVFTADLQTWPFTTSSEYTYDSAKIEVTSGVARLLAVDQTDSDNTASGFGGGSHTGTQWNSGSSFLTTASTTNVFWALPNNSTSSGWFDASNVKLLLHFDEASGAAGGFESSTNALTWACGTDCPTFGAASQVNTGADFDYSGTGDLVRVTNGYSNSTTQADNTMTVMFWTKIDNLDGGTNVFWSLDQHAAGTFLGINNDQNKNLWWRSNGGTQIFWNFGFTTGNWYHIAIVKSSATDITAYVNGRNFGTQTTDSAMVNTQYDWYIGGWYGNDSFDVDGMIDEFAVFNTSLTQQEISKIYERQRQSVSVYFNSRIMDAGSSVNWDTFSWQAQYPYGKELPNGGTSESGYGSGNFSMSNNILLLHLNESPASNGTIMDDAYGTNDGTLTTDNSTNDKSIPAIFSNGILFDAEDYIIGTSTLNISSTTYSISLWTRMTANTSLDVDTPLFTEGINGKGVFVWMMNDAGNGTGNILGGHRNSDAVVFPQTTNAAMLIGNWYHVVVTYDKNAGTPFHIYVNAAEPTINEGIDKGWQDLSGQVYYVAAHPATSNAEFTGAIDEVAVFNRTLSSAEVTDLYNRGRARVYYQVRSCVQSNCSDGRFVGISGTPTTTISELDNHGGTEGAITITSLVSANRYFQYRAIFEAASSSYSSPSVDSLTVGPAHYPSDDPTIQNVTGVSYTNLTSFTETAGAGNAGTIRYQLSKDGSTWYYYGTASSSWTAVPASSFTYANTSTDVNSNIANFASQVGTGLFFYKAFFHSSGGTQLVSLDKIEVNVETAAASPTVQFATSAYSGLESVASTSVQVTLSASTSQNVLVTIGILASSTATSTGSFPDYVLSTTTVTIVAGTTSTIVTSSVLSITSDALYETGETILLTIVTTTNQAILGTVTNTTYTITNDDSVPQVTFVESATSSLEATTTRTVLVQLSNPSIYAITATYAAAASSTATTTGNPIDYTLTTTTVTIAAQATTTSVPLTILDDTRDENDETIILTLSTTTNSTIGTTSTMTYTITDDDSAPTVDFSAASGSGAEDTVTTTQITLTLSTTSAKTVTVYYSVATSSTATSTDYTLNTTSTVISAGSVTNTFTLLITSDTRYENNETVIITLLTSSTNATVGSTSTFTYTITNDDALPTVQFSASSFSAAENAGTGQFTITLSAASDLDVVATYGITGGTATQNTDYTLNTTTTTISAGSTSTAVSITLTDDSTDEFDETILLGITSSTNSTLAAPTTTTFTITDNDAAPNIGFDVASSAGSEATTPVTLTAQLSAVSAKNVLLEFTVSGGTATTTGNYADAALVTTAATISAGSTTTSVQFTVTNDALDEADETMIILISSSTYATITGTTTHTYTIQDNDSPPSVFFASASGAGAESVTPASFTFQLSATSGRDILVNYSVRVASSTATSTGSPVDFTLTSTSTTIPAYAATATVNITIADDAYYEDNETVVVILDSADYASTGSTSTFTYTIQNNDSAPTVSFSPTSTSGAESASSASLAVTLSATSSKDVIITYGIAASSTATSTGSAVDFSLSGSTATILAGRTTTSISLSITDDAKDEFDETVIIMITTSTSSTIGNDTFTYTITDNDAAPDAAFSASASSVSESAGTASVTLALSTTSEKNVVVYYQVKVASSTATSTGSYPDFSLATSSNTITAGSTTTSFTVTIINDSLDEVDEDIVLEITTSTYGTASGTLYHTITVTDNDNPPTVSFSMATSSGSESVTSVSIQLSLSTTSGKNVTINYVSNTLSSTATTTGAFPDYSLSGSNVSIPAGSTTTSISLTVTDDGLNEADETVVVDITSATNATTSSPASYTYTILNNDSFNIQFTLTTSSAAESTTAVSVEIRASTTTVVTTTVDYAVSGGTATLNTDYTITTGTASIGVGRTTTTVSFTVINDGMDENDETIILLLSNPTIADLGDNTTYTYTVTDDDAAPEVNFTATTGSGAENTVSSPSILVQLATTSAKTVTVTYAVAASSTASGSDYSLSTTTVTVNAGATTTSIPLTITGDTTDENDETVILTLSTSTNSTMGSTTTFTYTITDDDAAPEVNFTATTGSGNEDSASSPSIVLQLAAASAKTVTVTYAASAASTATTTGSPIDYSLSTTTVTIAAGLTTTSVPLTINSDTIDENNETIVLTLSNATNATVGSTSTFTYTITDDDASPSVGFAATAASQSESVTSASITVEITTTSGRNVTVAYDVTGGTATNSSDYSVTTGTATIVAGATSTAISLTIINDGTDELDQTIIFTLSNPGNASLGTSTFTYTITDNDNPPEVAFSASASSGNENSVPSPSVAIQLTTTSEKTITVTYGVDSSSTASGADYSFSTTTVTISAGSISTNTPLTITADTLDEINETVIFTISQATNATASGTLTHTYTILDDDSPPTIGFSSATSSGSEATASTTLTLVLSAASGKTVTVDLLRASASSTANSSTDFGITPTSTSIAAGATSTTISLTVTNDQIDESDETAVAEIAAVTNATTSSVWYHTYTIQDNDTAGVTVTETGGSTAVSETGPTSDTYTLVLTSQPTNTVTITIAASDSNQVTLSTSTIVFTSSNWNQSVTVTTTAQDDAVAEGNHTVSITHTAASNDAGYNGISIANVSVSITDNDSPTIAFALATSSALESVTSGVLTVQLATTTLVTTTFTYQIVSASTTASGSGVDYTLSNGTGTISPGRTTTTISFSVTDDSLDETDEVFVVRITTSTNADLGFTVNHTYTILDNDNPPDVAFSASASSGNEDTASPAITVQLSTTSAKTVTITYTIDASSTASGIDYALSTTTVTISAGSTTTSIPLTMTADGTDENNETVILTISTSTNATASGTLSHTYTIIDDDNPPTVDFTASSGSGSESSASPSVVLQLTTTSAKTITVTYAVGGSSTAGGSDYSLSTTTATISAGSTTTSVPLTVTDDSLDEDNETVVLSLSTSTNATIGSTSTFTYTITDDDASPTVFFASATGQGAETVTTTPITVQISAVSGRAVQVSYSISASSTATGSGTDYTLTSGTATISAGNTTTSISLVVTTDSLDEDNETVILALSGPSNASLGTTTTFTYTIQDSNSAPTISFSTSTASGSESATAPSLTVSLSAVSGKTVTVQYADILTGSATANTDYTFTSGTTTISAGQTSATISFAVENDGLIESNETVVVGLSNAGNATLAAPTSTTYTITNNDTAGVTLSSNAVAAAEGGSNGTYTVVLTASPTSSVTVQPVVTSQVTVSPSSVTFTSSTWDTPQTITVRAVDDTDTEGTHVATITHTIAADDSHFSSLSVGSVIVTITDNESTGGAILSVVKFIPQVIRNTIITRVLSPVNTPVPEPKTESRAEQLEKVVSQVEALGDKQTVEVRPQQPVIFSVGGAAHIFTVFTATNDRARIEIQSDPIVLDLGRGESRDIDTDGDGVNDVRVTYKGLVNGTPKFDMTSLIDIFERVNSMTVNKGAYQTASRDVALDFKMTGVTQMAISNSSDFSHAGFVPYQSEAAWTLSAGEGLKTVYVRFRTAEGYTVDTYDTIVYLTQKTLAQQTRTATSTHQTPTAVPAKPRPTTAPLTEPQPSPQDAETGGCPLETERPYRMLKDQGVYYITKDCTRRPFRSSELYFSYFASWKDVIITTPQLLNRIPDDVFGFMPYGPLYQSRDGFLVKTTQSAKTFLLVGETRHWITSEAAFHTLGFAYRAIRDVAGSFLDRFREGHAVESPETIPNYVLIRYADTPSMIYRLEPDPLDPAKQIKRYVANESALKRLNYEASSVVTLDPKIEFPDGPPITF